MSLRRRDYRAVEIDGDDAAWLCGQTLPDGAEVVAIDEVEFFGATYEMAPGSSLYVPTTDDATARAIDRALAQADEPPALIGVDLFAGAGGFSLGMHTAGIDVVAAVEWDAPAATTYLWNLGREDCRILFATPADEARWTKATTSRRRTPTARVGDRPVPYEPGWIGSARRPEHVPHGCRAFAFGDVTHVTGAQLMDAAGVDHVDVVFGGPPCQGLSTSNSKACLEDPRNGMIWEYLRLVRELHPRAFIIENVPQILTVAKGALFNAIAALANEAGYDVVATKLDAAQYGVPQHRVRAIIMGSMAGQPALRFPMPTHWSIGRPVEGDSWSMLANVDGRYQERLPRQARFDAETRRWSFSEQPPAPAPRPESDTITIDLFEEVV